MAITIGTQLGSHEITALIGKGGMGEVYRARDTRLNRDVAIKVLPDEFVRDPDRVARFHREAQSIAALNHPNIAAIHEFAELAATKFLVLELVEGETLAERLERGALPVDETVHIAKQICEALEAAHEKGVIHRDLKPANVKITPEGKVKVLDFGLAKALETAPSNASLSNSPTLSLAATNVGVILGTAAYMSPEQAKAFNTDQRSDIFSFGCVLYEMLTGRQAFQGDVVSEILASVLKSEADLTLLPPRLNPKLTELLRRCLEKNPKKRWHAAADVRVELESILGDPRGVLISEDRAVVARPLWKRALLFALNTIVVGAMAAFTAWYLKPAGVRTITRFPIALAEGQSFTNAGRRVVAISPDGTHMVYVANTRLYLRPMAELEARPIPGTETFGSVLNPVFSPDGRSVAFWAGGDQTFKRIAITGGAAVTICSAEAPFGMSWSEDGIVFGQGSKGVMRVSGNGGKPELLVSLGADEFAHGSQMLPGGQAVLFTLAKGGAGDRWDTAQIVVQELASGARKVLFEGGSDAHYVSTGHIVYAVRGILFAVPFDLGELEVIGGPVPVIEGVLRAAATGTGTAATHFSFSETGSLIYIPGPLSNSTVQRSLALADRKGGVELLKLQPDAYATPRVSPDGKQIAFGTDDGKEAVIWIYDLSGSSSMRRLTFGGANRYPVWTADGQRVAFQSDREGDVGVFWQRADGSGSAERLTKAEQGVTHRPFAWSPDGQKLAFASVKNNDWDVWIFSLPDKKTAPLVALPKSQQASADFSPDGRWLAYQSDETGTLQVYVQPFPTTGAKFQISRTGMPLWSPDGKELFLNFASGQYRVTNIRTQPSFTFSEPSPLQIRIPTQGPAQNPRNFDVLPDGQRFIGVVPADTTDATGAALHIQVVLNWFEDLKQRVPVD